MTTATVTSNGQITIPDDVRRALAVKAGDRLEFVQINPGEFLLIAVNRSVSELKGVFGKPRVVVSIDDMNRVIGARGGLAG
jgi:AbrB family looped-hinge helix DNA binding protein